MTIPKQPEMTAGGSDVQLDDLRRRLDDEAAERRKLTLLLTHQTEPKAEQPTRSRLYEKLFGRR
jgi:hypothetical protein